MNKLKFSASKSSGFYLLIILMMLGFILFKIPAVNIDTSVLSLLPKAPVAGLNPDIEKSYISKIDSQVMFLVKTPDLKKLNQFYEKLGSTGIFQELNGKISPRDKEESFQFLYTYKTSLLSPALRQDLSGSSYGDRVLQQLYSSFAGVSGKEFATDPLLLTRNVAGDFASSSLFQIKNDFPAIEKNQELWYFISGQLKSSGMDTGIRKEVSAINDCINDLAGEDFQVLKRGALFYSAAASDQVIFEMNLIGIIASVLVFLLIYLVFHSLLPLVMTISSVLCGLISGLFFLLCFFDSINMIMLGMCLSVIGIVCDYTIYYMTMRMHHHPEENAFATIRRMKFPLLCAAGTDVVAYFIILLSPVTPLKQLALFSMAAITSACLFVILVEPCFAEKISSRTNTLPRFTGKYLTAVGRRSISLALILGFSILSFTGLMLSTGDDDPRSLQTLPEELTRQDQMISEITGVKNSQKYVLLQAGTADKLAELNEQTGLILERLKNNGVLDNYFGLKFNSPARQKKDFALVDMKTRELEKKFADLRLPVNAVYSHKILTLEKFFASVPGRAYANFYAQSSDDKALIILVDGVHDESTLKKELQQLPQVFFQNRHQDYLDIFHNFRLLIMQVIMVFSGVICVVSILRLGIRKGLMAWLFSLISLLSALGAVTLAGYTLNLFITLALLLISGIGINYTIFFASSGKENRSISLSAVFTSLVTTLLTVGILGFSSVRAVSGFAICLSAGLVTSFILATLLPHFFKDHD
ncbi:MAG: MMPL family transporter [Succinivibrionaceae bacterium]